MRIQGGRGAGRCLFQQLAYIGQAGCVSSEPLNIFCLAEQFILALSVTSLDFTALYPEPSKMAGPTLRKHILRE